MRFHMRRFADAARRTGDWLILFGRRLRGALTSRFFLAPLLCVVFVWLYARYITHLNVFVFYEQDRMTILETYTRDAETALAEAGIHIRGNDLVSLPQGSISGSAAEIQIIRTNEVAVTLDGLTVPVICLGGTVADALEKAGYTSEPLDIVSPPAGTPIEEGMAITVTRIRILTKYEYEAIPFDSIEQDSQYVNFGASVTTTEGEDGERKRTYEVILRDGVVISNRLTQEEIIKEPVTEIVVNGTGGTITLEDGTRRRYTRRLDVVCTAYTTERQASKTNAIGNVARRGTIAVDPKVIPLRIDVFVTSRNGKWVYGLARTEDTGGVVKGNIIDLFYDTWDECVQFGRRTGYLYILS